MTFRTLEFYCGIGGLHQGLRRACPTAQVISAFDWDQTACQVYAANHGTNIVKADIGTLTSDQLSKLNANIWLLSPACQPYTVLNPNAKGAQDPRAKSFLHLIEAVLPELSTINKHPDYILVENVAGFEARSSTTRQTLLDTLDRLGYNTLELLLTPLQYGIPNSRLRYYLLAKKRPLSFFHSPSTDSIWRYVPGTDSPFVDPRNVDPDSGLVVTADPVSLYLDESGSGKEFRVPDKVLEKWGRLFDIVKPSSHRTCCFTRGYTKLVERAGSILQENEELDTTEVFDKFLAAQVAGDASAVEILRPLRLRYFSPSELLRIFSFTPISQTATFSWPATVSNKSKYKLIGNSVNVQVIEALISYLLKNPDENQSSPR